ncbi:hypothetical protein Dda_7150 [Drechslerella dactyloides]|uniref:Uncharacterized protein n=1 Tax=Drechslerella dactyloides TaxID=74499 RepID=A0AAD6ITR6_DREDA|nr:hypothetical protein Dda_7150 [Drechslerella dactyloides]
MPVKRPLLPLVALGLLFAESVIAQPGEAPILGQSPVLPGGQAVVPNAVGGSQGVIPLPAREKIATWATGRLAKLSANRPPREIPTVEEFDDSVLPVNSITIRPEAWEIFMDHQMIGFGGSSPIYLLWWAGGMLIGWRESLDRLLHAVYKFQGGSSGPFAKKITSVYQSLIRDLMLLTNYFAYHPDRAKPPSKDRIDPGPVLAQQALFDANGLLEPVPPNLAHDPFVRALYAENALKGLFRYEELRPDREIILSDNRFLNIWDIADYAHRRLVRWLNEEFTPLMDEMNHEYYPDSDLLANTWWRPLGIWKRQEIGYQQYWMQKYGKIYKYIPPDFGYWETWESNTVKTLPGIGELLLFATHSTGVGLVRGLLPYILELFSDIAGVAWTLGDSIPLRDPDFAVPGGPSMGLSIDLPARFLVNQPERNATNYVIFGNGQWADKWDDEAEIARNEWRDSAITKAEKARMAISMMGMRTGNMIRGSMIPGNSGSNTGVPKGSGNSSPGKKQPR